MCILVTVPCRLSNCVDSLRASPLCVFWFVLPAGLHTLRGFMLLFPAGLRTLCVDSLCSFCLLLLFLRAYTLRVNSRFCFLWASRLCVDSCCCFLRASALCAFSLQFLTWTWPSCLRRRATTYREDCGPCLTALWRTGTSSFSR